MWSRDVEKAPQTLVPVLLLGSFLLVLFLANDPFESDESIYVYAGYAISRGLIPYREIALAHPPVVYLLISFSVTAFGSNLLSLRVLRAVFMVLSLTILYLVVRSSSVQGSKVACLSLALFSFFLYPMYQRLALLEIVLTSTSLSCVLVYLKARSDTSHWRRTSLFLLLGLAASISFLTKYPALLVASTLFVWHVVSGFLLRRGGRHITDVSLSMLGFTVPTACFSLWLTLEDAVRTFYAQTIYWQMVRYAVSNGIAALAWYCLLLLPLLAVTPVVILTSAKDGNRDVFLFLLLFIVPLISMTAFLQTFWFHYTFYLGPYLAILGSLGWIRSWRSLGVRRLVSRTFRTSSGGRRLLASSVACCALFFPTVAASTQQFMRSSGSEIEVIPRPLPREELIQDVAGLARLSTDYEDRVWTSEAAIAFLADRLITPPNSSDWPVQGFFDDLLAHSFGGYRGDGMRDYKLGAVSPRLFIEAWESERTKVLVFILGAGPIPYPDELLWHGYGNAQGVREYVESKYLLKETVCIPQTDSAYVYHVWVRRGDDSGRV
ncbi:MAG: glycosyltransferase family 39 protein [Candidatus Bathyarchaeia archaeon]